MGDWDYANRSRSFGRDRPFERNNRSSSREEGARRRSQTVSFDREVSVVDKILPLIVILCLACLASAEVKITKPMICNTNNYEFWQLPNPYICPDYHKSPRDEPQPLRLSIY